jgi:cellulose synthase/poly-beta-1,6-N-acetylglucosamine synthase-like glycosyltransferase
MDRIPCSIGIMAHNEASNIGRLLDAIALQEEKVTWIKEVIVVASGCTDNTIAVVDSYCSSDPRITLLVQPRREGKTSAINLFIARASSEVLVMESADTVPEPTTIDRIVSPFSDPAVGMVGGHPVPVNSRDTFIGFVGHLIWRLHHQLSLCHPKCGELVAWRNLFPAIPATPVDEAIIEAMVVAKGLKLAYAEEAMVCNCTPLSVGDFVGQRRRIWAGHVQMKRDWGYNVSTMSGRRVLRGLMGSTHWRPKSMVWTLGAALLEQYARFLGTLDVMLWRKDHTIWDVVESTKLVQHDLR